MQVATARQVPQHGGTCKTVQVATARQVPQHGPRTAPQLSVYAGSAGQGRLLMLVSRVWFRFRRWQLRRARIVLRM